MSGELTPNGHGFGKNLAVAAGLLVGAVVAYRKLSPEKSSDLGEDYFAVIDDLDPRVVRAAGPNLVYLVVGGGPTSVFSHPDAKYDFDGEAVGYPDTDKPLKRQYRNENHTMSDVDVIVVSADPEEVAKVRRALTPSKKILDSKYVTQEQKRQELDKPGAKLKIGVTGLLSATEFDKKPESLSGKLMHMFKKDWVSQRIVYPDGSYALAYSDIRVPIPEEYFRPWRIILKSGNTIPTLDPIIHAACYPARASHGIRPRDVEKVESIINNIGTRVGARLIWGDKNQTVSINVCRPIDDATTSTLSFVDQKNRQRYKYTKERLGKKEAAILATRMAIHRQLDTRKFFTQFGQGGWLYDNVISRFSRESQEDLED